MPKRPCTNRAAWRLVRGQPSQHLSAHYRLECDYGTAFTAIYKEGDAVYLCEGHASSVRNLEAPTIAGVRLIQNPPADGTEPAKGEEPPPISVPETVPPSSSIQPVPEIQDGPLHDAATRAPTQTVQAEAAKSNEPVEPQPQAAKESAFVSAEPEIGALATNKPVASSEPFYISRAETAKPSGPAAQESEPRVAAATARRENARPAAKAFVRDLAYGDCAKALVAEAIWNLEPGDFEAYRAALFEGKPAAEAAQAAGGQLAIVLRRINEYATKIEGLLSESSATIDVDEAIDKPFEQAMLDIIGESTLSEAEKDSAVDHLGALQKKIDGGLNRVISALQAHRITIAIAERANWGAKSNLAEELRPAYRVVYTAVRNALVLAVPEARVFDERLANLYAAKSDIASAPTIKALHSALK